VVRGELAVGVDRQLSGLEDDIDNERPAELERSRTRPALPESRLFQSPRVDEEQHRVVSAREVPAGVFYVRTIFTKGDSV
jgi:hypothetical protein